MSSNVTKVKVTLISWRVPFELCKLLFLRYNCNVNEQSWRVPFELCKLLFLRYNCNVNEQDFFSPVRDQNIEREKSHNASRMVKPSNREITRIQDCPQLLPWAGRQAPYYACWSANTHYLPTLLCILEYHNIKRLKKQHERGDNHGLGNMGPYGSQPNSVR
jgi:hypothetical protein